MYTSYTNSRSLVTDEFNRIRVKARMGLLIARVIGKNNKLKFLSQSLFSEQHGKIYAGIQNIPTDKISGTVSRMDDFDQDFRPLKKHLRQRWVNMFLLRESDSWGPIIVHRVGEEYFVEDGHHRVSVAKLRGMLFIEAEVWDHSAPKAVSYVERYPCQPVTNQATICAAD